MRATRLRVREEGMTELIGCIVLCWFALNGLFVWAMWRAAR